MRRSARPAGSRSTRHAVSWLTAPEILAAVQTRRWVNQSQPQTLFIATVLLYFNVVLIVLGGSTLLGAAIDGHKLLGTVVYGETGETINNFARLFLAVGGAGAGYL